MQRYVEIMFDCLPLRSIGRMDIPIDASPRYRARCERIKSAIETHGSHNTYYLYNAHCIFHLTNAPELGMLDFSFEGTVMTDDTDRASRPRTSRSHARARNVRLAHRAGRHLVQGNRPPRRDGRVRPLHRRRRSGASQAPHRSPPSQSRPNRRLHGHVSLSPPCKQGPAMSSLVRLLISLGEFLRLLFLHR